MCVWFVFMSVCVFMFMWHACGDHIWKSEDHSSGISSVLTVPTAPPFHVGLGESAHDGGEVRHSKPAHLTAMSQKKGYSQSCCLSHDAHATITGPTRPCLRDFQFPVAWSGEAFSMWAFCCIPVPNCSSHTLGLTGGRA